MGPGPRCDSLFWMSHGILDCPETPPLQVFRFFDTELWILYNTLSEPWTHVLSLGIFQVDLDSEWNITILNNYFEFSLLFAETVEECIAMIAPNILCPFPNNNCTRLYVCASSVTVPFWNITTNWRCLTVTLRETLRHRQMTLKLLWWMTLQILAWRNHQLQWIPTLQALNKLNKTPMHIVIS